MMNTLSYLSLAAAALLFASAHTASPSEAPIENSEKTLSFGNFSVSLAVKDLKASMAFYKKLDFKQVGGSPAQNYAILQNGTTTIGVFQGMFPKNIMTFNPGWDKDKNTLKEFQDIRDLQSALKKRGLKMTLEADEKTKGPASFMIVDPDGNSILVDQHVKRPSKK